MRVYNINGIDEIIAFLSEQEIDTEIVQYKLDSIPRAITFCIGGVTYKILWNSNVSTLFIGDVLNAPFIQFRYLEINTTWPSLTKGHKGLAFSYLHGANQLIIPFES